MLFWLFLQNKTKIINSSEETLITNYPCENMVFMSKWIHFHLNSKLCYSCPNEINFSNRIYHLHSKTQCTIVLNLSHIPSNRCQVDEWTPYLAVFYFVLGAGLHVKQLPQHEVGDPPLEELAPPPVRWQRG